MITRFRKVLRNAAMGAFVALGASGASQATLVVGVFDPAFGAALSGTNFSGVGQFNISQNCLNQGYNLFVYTFDNCGGSNPSGMSFISAHVDFSGALTGTVDFGSSALNVLGMYVQNNHVIGVQTTLSTGATATGGLAGDVFKIIFGLTNPTFETAAQEGTVPSGPDHPGDGDLDDQLPGVFQVTHLDLISGPACSRPGVTCPSQSNSAATSFVPEPGSLALVLGALGAGWLTRSKKRRSTGAALAA